MGIKRCSYSVLGAGRKLGRRAAVVVLADLVAGAWLALRASKPARAGANVVYLPVVTGPPVLVWDTAGDTWDNGAVWG